jgi:hypothetical protein
VSRRSRGLSVAVAFVLALFGDGALARDVPHAALSFESGDLRRWNSDGALSLDSTTVHGGRHSGRLERLATSGTEYVACALTLPVDFAGDSLELRGWLRLENVVGSAGLWQRQEGRAGVLQFDSMARRELKGTIEWAEYRLVLPLAAKARTVVVGAILEGSGRLWIDDLEIRVDGKPLADVPVKLPPRTVLETDHEFDGGSKLDLVTVDGLQTEGLLLLAKVWGFLKYHHPRVTRGEIHWDYELFRVAPRVLAARDRGEVRRVLTRWIDGLGRVPRCTRCAPTPEGRPLMPRLAWLEDESFLGRELSARLRHVHANRESLDTQFYVELTLQAGNAEFVHELGYGSTGLPDAGYRLLALFRFWNMVEYWFPYRDLLEEDWDLVLRDFIPVMLASASRADYQLDLIRLFGRLHDSHANLWRSLGVRPPVGDCAAPVAVRFAEGRAVVASYTNTLLGPASGLEIGDVVERLDGVAVDSLIARWRPWFPASNEAARLRDVAAMLTRGGCDSVHFQIEREGRTRTAVVARAHLASLGAMSGSHDRPGDTFRRVSGELAYLKLSSVRVADAADYVRQAAGARCLLIDIRNYPSEFVVFALGNRLVAKRTEFATFTRGDLSNPGAFDWTTPVALEPAAPRFEGRVAVLVDETTQSQAEYTAMAFRAAGAVVVGTPTAGADGNISRVPLPGGIEGVMTGIGVFYPDHRPTQRTGIVPDVVARPTIAGIRAGRDEVLEAAVRHVLGRELTEAELQGLELPPRSRP